MTAQEKETKISPIYSLISLEDFKSLLGIDDREEKLSRFCLITATYSIEHYCKRQLLRKKHFEKIEYIGDLMLPMKEYPVNRMLALYSMNREPVIENKWEILEPDFYQVIPECGTYEDIPYTLVLSPAIKRYPGILAVKAVYWAGYSQGSVPPDLASACLEFASWNMNRYRGRRIGMTGNIRGSGKDGEHFELSMPENIKALLEPYRRKVI